MTRQEVDEMHEFLLNNPYEKWMENKTYRQLIENENKWIRYSRPDHYDWMKRNGFIQEEGS